MLVLTTKTVYLSVTYYTDGYMCKYMCVHIVVCMYFITLIESQTYSNFFTSKDSQTPVVKNKNS